MSVKFSILVENDIPLEKYGVRVRGFDYETDSYNPWIHSYLFNTIGGALEFKRELEALEWVDGEYTLPYRDEALSPLLRDKFECNLGATLTAMPYAIFRITAQVNLIDESEYRKFLIDDVLTEL